MNIKKIKIFNGTDWVEYTLDAAANLEVGNKPGATQTKDAVWNGGEQKDEENIIRIKDGDTVEGAIADGFQSVAFGGARYDEFRKNDKESKQVPTAVYGNQSFAAGGNVYVHGDFSAGFGKDVNAYQRCAFVMGGGAQAGRTKEEFEDRLKVVTGVNGVIAPMYTTINVTENGDLVDSDSITREYAGATYAYDGYDSASGQFKYKLKIVLANDVYSPPENITFDAEEVAKLPYSDYEGKPYNISYSFATAFGGSKAWGRGSFGMGGGLAYGDYTLAGGTGSLAYEDNSIAFGERVHAAGIGSVAFGEGLSSLTDAYGLDRNYGALGKYSAHFGRLNKARGNYSFVIGNSNTVAGMYSFASGSLNTVNGNNQFAHGVGLITGSSKDGQVIFGKYNNTSYINNMAFAVGNGTSDSDRKNLLTLYQDGRLRLSDNITETLALNDVPRLKDVQEVVSTEIAKVVDSAPETFNTLKEIADWIEGPGVNTTELTAAIAEETKNREDEDKKLQDVIEEEISNRQEEDSNLQTQISNEADTRQEADIEINKKLDTLGNIVNGEAEASNVTADTIYTGADVVYSDGSIGLKSNTIVEGGRATGFGAVALGGMRFGYSDFGSTITLADKIEYRIEYQDEAIVYYKLNDSGVWEYFTSYDSVLSFGQKEITINGIVYNAINDMPLNTPFHLSRTAIDGKPYGFREGEFPYYVCPVEVELEEQSTGEIYKSEYCYGRTPTSAEGRQSFAAGASVHAIGDFSVALNKDTVAYQNSSMAIGGGTQAGMTEDDYFELYTLTPDKFPVPTTELDSANHYQKYMPVNQSVSGYTNTYCALYKYENGKLYYTHVNYANNSVFPGIYTPEECLRSNYTEVRDVQGSSYDSSYSFAFAGGALSKAYEKHTFAFGSSTTAKARNAVAFNSNTIASGLSSFATGIGPDETYIATNGEVGARGRVSFVEGKVTDATGEAAHAGGAFTSASGDYSFAFGNNIVVNGTSSAAFGSSNNIYLNSNYSFVAGLNNNIQYGSQNIILGNTNIIGNPSSTKGCSNNFVANSSNIVDNTLANANNTAVFGLENTAKHSGVFITGHGNKSSNIYQTIIGTYNKDNSDALLIVGSGTADANRKNAFEVLKDGIKINSLKALSDTDQTIYFNNNLNGRRISSIWANDISFIPNPTGKDENGKVQGSYRSLSSVFSFDEDTGILSINW